MIFENSSKPIRGDKTDNYSPERAYCELPRP